MNELNAEVRQYPEGPRPLAIWSGDVMMVRKGFWITDAIVVTRQEFPDVFSAIDRHDAEHDAIHMEQTRRDAIEPVTRSLLNFEPLKIPKLTDDVFAPILKATFKPERRVEFSEGLLLKCMADA